MTEPVAIVGSGFAGTILARALRRRGREVLLLERETHPRFALGESSTPLAAICLERLAEAYGLDDLRALAAYGRWLREMPEVPRGLKRGFTFYGHRRGRPYENGPRNGARLLVAASPDEEIADAHWLRAAVDHRLVRRAAEEGVEVLEGCEVIGLERAAGGWRLRTRQGSRDRDLRAGFVVDAAGAGGPLATRAGDGEVPAEPRTGLVFGHFTGVGSFLETAPDASFAGAPYPEERAAVHHLLEEGWFYALPFDDGRISAGFVLDRSVRGARRLLEADPDEAWRELMARYPSLARQFEGARPVRPPGSAALLQRRAGAASGPGWARLPHAHAFVSPMFSTGIAWSLRAVERLAHILADPTASALEAYARLVEAETDHLWRIVAPAYRWRRDFDRFAAWSMVYFAAASFEEARQRLCDPPEDGWRGAGFLGATDPRTRALLRDAAAALEREPPSDAAGDARADRWERAVGRAIEARNVAGLADPERRRCYPVLLDELVRRSALLGLDPSEARSRLPRLRSSGPDPASSGIRPEIRRGGDRVGSG